LPKKSSTRAAFERLIDKVIADEGLKAI